VSRGLAPASPARAADRTGRVPDGPAGSPEAGAAGSTYTCSKLEGKLKLGEGEGDFTLWLCENLPGGQVRAELSFKGENGDTKVIYEPHEIHIEK